MAKKSHKNLHMWDFFCTFAPDFDDKSYIVHR